MKTSPIVVGYDGSERARAAFRWALDDAVHRDAPVLLVHAFDPTADSAGLFPTPWTYTGEGYRQRVQTELADAVAEAAKRQPTVEVVPEVLDGRAASVLCERSRGARIVVLGSRGLGGFTGLLVGSVSMTVASHAHCSVVVVHDGEDAQAQGKPVVVGLDDSPEAHLAVAFAAEEAAARGVGLVGMRAWSPPTAPWHTDVRPLVLDTAELETAEQHRLTAALGNWSDKYPTLRVATRLVSGDARQALTEATDDAQLVVVGRRGRGGLASLMLGSVSHYLLHHARCPVAVVRPGGPQA